MSLKPEQSFGSFTLSGTTAILYIDSIDIETIHEPFDRQEFSHAKLLSAPENTGVVPQVGSLIGGVPYQIRYSNVNSTVRNLQPDDTDLNNIYKQFVIERMTMKGTTSLNSDTSTMYGWSKAHKFLLSLFDAHQKLASGNVSIQELITLQAETFSFLTTTGLTIITNTCGNRANCLVRSFKVEGDYDTSSAGALNSWEGVFDQITIKNLTDAS